MNHPDSLHFFHRLKLKNCFRLSPASVSEIDMRITGNRESDLTCLYMCSYASDEKTPDESDDVLVGELWNISTEQKVEEEAS